MYADDLVTLTCAPPQRAATEKLARSEMVIEKLESAMEMKVSRSRTPWKLADD